MAAVLDEQFTLCLNAESKLAKRRLRDMTADEVFPAIGDTESGHRTVRHEPNPENAALRVLLERLDAAGRTE